MLFDVQVTSEGERDVARVVGDIDLSSLPRLSAALEALEGTAVVDLRSVDWVDPVCLGALVAADLRARRRGDRLTLVARGRVADLLAETRLDQVLDVADDELPA